MPDVAVPDVAVLDVAAVMETPLDRRRKGKPRRAPGRTAPLRRRTASLCNRLLPLSGPAWLPVKHAGTPPAVLRRFMLGKWTGAAADLVGGLEWHVED